MQPSTHSTHHSMLCWVGASSAQCEHCVWCGCRAPCNAPASGGGACRRLSPPKERQRRSRKRHSFLSRTRLRGQIEPWIFFCEIAGGKVTVPRLISVQMCPGLQARHGCELCSHLLKETDAPAVVDIRQAAPLVSQRGARQTRAALETQQKGDRWKIRFFVSTLRGMARHALEYFLPRLSKGQRLWGTIHAP